jgi:hypothetical protein
MHRRALATLLLAHLTACTSSNDDTGAASSEGTAGEPDTTTTAPVTSTTGTDTADTSTGDPPTTGPGDDTGTSPTGDTTTGGPAYCNGWQTDAGEPYLVLHNKPMEVLTDGATLPLECGGQGIFMFALYAEFGGFMPTSEIVEFGVVADVEGFNNNPEGHFYNADSVGYYVGCEPLGGGPTGFVPIFTLDNLDDLAALDGKPADIEVVMRTDEGDVIADFSVVLSVQKDDSWALCGG